MESQLISFLGLGIPLLAAATAAILTYWRERRLRRRAQKQKLYSDLQLGIFNIWAAKGFAEREVEALRKISDAWIFASDKVLHQVNIFMQKYDYLRREKISSDHWHEHLQPIVAELFLYMRQDLFRNTDLTLEDAQKSVKYYPWVGKEAK